MGRRQGGLKRKDIEQVFDSGWSISSPTIVAKGLWREDLGECRAAVVSGKTLGSAVMRNRGRRRVRGSLQRAERGLPAGLDAVLIVRRRALNAGPTELDADMAALLERIEGMERP